MVLASSLHITSRRRLGRRPALRSWLGLAIVAIVATLVTPQIGGATGPRTQGAHDPKGTVLVRTGDPAPVAPRVSRNVEGRLALTSTGGLLFRESGGTSLYLKEGGATSLVAWSGEQVPGGTIQTVRGARGLPDGSLVVQAYLTKGSETLLQVPAGGGAPSVLLGSQQPITMPGGAVTTLSGFWPDAPAIDGAGRIVVNAFLSDYGTALLRIVPGAPPEVLIHEGDPIFDANVVRLQGNPGVSPSGKIAFFAQAAHGAMVLATLTPGSPPELLRAFPAAPPATTLPYVPIAPAIDDSGVVAYYLFDSGNVSLQRVSGTDSVAIAGPGVPAPGGGFFSSACCSTPVFDAAGGILFGAYRDSPPHSGFYRYAGVTDALVESGGVVDDGSAVQTVTPYPDPVLGS